jgi:hypothetical protein
LATISPSPGDISGIGFGHWPMAMVESRGLIYLGKPNLFCTERKIFPDWIGEGKEVWFAFSSTTASFIARSLCEADC